jgi:hypothetical protein
MANCSKVAPKQSIKYVNEETAGKTFDESTKRNGVNVQARTQGNKHLSR